MILLSKEASARGLNAAGLVFFNFDAGADIYIGSMKTRRSYPICTCVCVCHLYNDNATLAGATSRRLRCQKEQCVFSWPEPTKIVEVGSRNVGHTYQIRPQSATLNPDVREIVLVSWFRPLKMVSYNRTSCDADTRACTLSMIIAF